MKSKIRAELLKISHHPKTNKQVLSGFYKRLDQDSNVIKATNTADHFCCFFVPFHSASSSVFLGHHKKADDWIPPGGHIEENEHPVDTVLRECREELDFTCRKENVIFFDITIKPITPSRECKIHYDLWYLIKMEKKHKFQYLKQEFFNAGWFSIDQAIQKIAKNPDFANVIKKLKTRL